MVTTSVRLVGLEEPIQLPDALPFGLQATGDFFRSPGWLENVRRHAAPAGDRLRLYEVRAVAEPQATEVTVARAEALEPVGLIPVVYSRFFAQHPRARVMHFTHPDGLEFSPLCRPGVDDPMHAIEPVLGYLFRSRRAYDVLRFGPLAKDARLADDLAARLRRAGHPVMRYPAADDCFASTTPGAPGAYLGSRPAERRQALEAAAAALAAAGHARLRLVRLSADADRGWADIEAVTTAGGAEVSGESLAYLPGLVQAAAQAGALRLGFLDIDGTAAAAQLWIVSAGRARCLRSVARARASDPPLLDVLMQHMARRLIVEDRVGELVFGALERGAAVYWSTGCRARIGIAAFNPHTWRGAAGAIRHIGGRFAKSLVPRR